MKAVDRRIKVFLDTGIPQSLGFLRIHATRGREVFSFEFAETWLGSRTCRMLDPDLQLYAGPQFTTKPNFGLFLDSAPDRWGRQLMRRRESLCAREEKRPPKPLPESEYLLGVFDQTRMGALRFCSEEGIFLSSDTQMATPPWTRLRDLEYACRKLELESGSDENEDKWLSLLIAPGSSLGGARPKANVVDVNGDLWIAKFPSGKDFCDTAAWEYVVNRLATQSGINVPETRLEKLSKHGSTLLSKRFDRIHAQRVHFASAMTLLGRMDGDEDASYLDLAQFIMTSCIDPERDLKQLWRRMAFSVAVGNTDDHLRNHGFLLGSEGWSLSPAFDVNPNPDGTALSLNINENDSSRDFDLLRSVAKYFRLSEKEADRTLREVLASISNWESVATALGISRSSQDRMRPAFKLH